MDVSIWGEYALVFLVLVVLEGILSADNAVVMAVIVKGLPHEKQRKALFYGLVGAFVFRFIALFLISFLVKIWEIQAIGAIYLLYLAIKHMWRLKKGKKEQVQEAADAKPTSFWGVVARVELTDIAFALDSMLAAAALVVTLPDLGNFNIGGMNGGQFIVMFLGGIAGLVVIRFAATQVVKLLERYPTLETAAFLIVGWVGVKMAVLTLAHPSVAIIPEDFPDSAVWKLTFWSVMLIIGLGGYIIARKKEKQNKRV
ncbi:TerC family protein [Listeria ivanovii]|uniref:TerC family protein n=2 Tax=Listeria ivanovii TaxID=1638 RepID=A0ABS1G1H3_LISIV|nr:TerC family protein [Listeria ivanovii]EFR97452.1 TerC family membrane protein [Listeria ivanovii FSL F6-596]AIS59415.1 membrane protein [Listeria ivanovii subsp. londoniensis]AIS62246.1 membrane protein [Listeria ivanovii subsp. londoniensis]MBC2255728.1 TerC family protein [Listeria ivanovii]MBK1960718.1 TerC family protein [Listeria ivanovii subsp. londoniensis]